MGDQTFQTYYKESFPASEIFEFFSRPFQTTPPFNPEQREWGVETLDGCFRRYKQCSNADDLRKLVAEKGVGKLNVGCVFDSAVSQRWKRSLSNPILPKQREFVIDIDLDDYSSAGFNIDKNDLPECDVHWPLVAIGLMICKEILQTTFGFQKFLCVYSGRRGGHLWVCDDRACQLSDEARSAIIKFLTPNERENEHGLRPFRFLLNYPTFGSGENPLFKSEIGKQSVFQRFIYKFWRKFAIQAKGVKGGLGLLDSRFERQRFMKMADLRFETIDVARVYQANTGRDAWQSIQENIGVQPEHFRALAVIRTCETICTMLWPRPDVSVSVHMNHTLKSPYSVHPGTGRVSVPIFNILEFDPAIDSPLATEPIPPSFAKNIVEFRRVMDHWATSSATSSVTSAVPSSVSSAVPPVVPSGLAPAQPSAKALGKRKAT